MMPSPTNPKSDSKQSIEAIKSMKVSVTHPLDELTPDEVRRGLHKDVP